MLPKTRDIIMPLLNEIYSRGGSTRPLQYDKNGKTVYDMVADFFNLSEDDRTEILIEDAPPRPRWRNKVQWARAIAIERGYLDGSIKGIWKITDEGINFLKINFNTFENKNLDDLKTSLIDFKKHLKNLEEIGEAGELFVMNYEINYLKKIGKINLAQKVQRISLIDVSAGYDILSYDSNGNKKYIEVKTTTETNEDFIITINELNHAYQLKEKYFIYRVYKINDKEPLLKIIENFYCKIDKEYSLKAIEYKVTKITS